MSHAVVAYFIVLVSSKYALESESGKREVFIYLPLILCLALLFAWQFQEEKKGRDANRGGEIFIV